MKTRIRPATSILTRTALGLLLVLLAPAGSMAQHETAADVLDGERAYRQTCANCHGPDGDVINGIDLGRGQFRRQMSDDDLVRTIRTGIPGTPMPPSNMTVEQAQKIVAYLRARGAAVRAGAVRGDAARGQALFEGKGGCLGCHRVNGVGSGVGPELSGIGAVRGALEIEQSLVDPNVEVQATNRFYRVVMRDGSIVTGRLLSHDTFTVQMLDMSERLRSFTKRDLREHGFAPTPMPSFRDRLTPQEIADLVGYLVSLRGRS
jgi:putative heme-binding domain-containing protein